MSLLTAREVSKRYGPVVALRSATLGRSKIAPSRLTGARANRHAGVPET
jgi:hypothetical protein